jgi:hypothetical protein
VHQKGAQLTEGYDDMPDEKSHAENIGIIVLAMAAYELNSGDCFINDPILSMLDEQRPAHLVIAELAKWSVEHAAGVAAQLNDPSTES